MMFDEIVHEFSHIKYTCSTLYRQCRWTFLQNTSIFTLQTWWVSYIRYTVVSFKVYFIYHMCYECIKHNISYSCKCITTFFFTINIKQQQPVAYHKYYMNKWRYFDAFSFRTSVLRICLPLCTLVRTLLVWDWLHLRMPKLLLLGIFGKKKWRVAHLVCLL